MRTWAGLTLKQRSVLFHRKFPEAKITPNILQRLYAKHQIRRKVVRMVKVAPPSKSEDYERLR